ncbi:ribonuclease P protein component [Luteimonas sp. SJ-92]|uniref:Ribonuclease P protein component n=1 Tax=Luteimonas salinisoli TaxID=2752307 RepID=A0A853J7E3_9GAMM|nr:ribonuclease P protein component [Luteimonas salinisoli]NZA24993.1 ribonuclease P protein component [Luteimonas salinisoli]
MTAGFPKQARVRARADFDRVFKQGRRTAAPLLALHWLDDGTPPRLGLAVSRKVDATAVGRNRIKRALREQFRALRPQLRPGAYVVVARPAAAKTASALLRTGFVAVLTRAGALPPPPPDGTMPRASSAFDPTTVPTPDRSGA